MENEDQNERYNNTFRLYDSFDKENSGDAELCPESPKHKQEVLKLS